MLLKFVFISQSVFINNILYHSWFDFFVVLNFSQRWVLLNTEDINKACVMIRFFLSLINHSDTALQDTYAKLCRFSGCRILVAVKYRFCQKQDWHYTWRSWQRLWLGLLDWRLDDLIIGVGHSLYQTKELCQVLAEFNWCCVSIPVKYLMKYYCKWFYRWCITFTVAVSLTSSVVRYF